MRFSTLAFASTIAVVGRVAAAPAPLLGLGQPSQGYGIVNDITGLNAPLYLDLGTINLPVRGLNAGNPYCAVGTTGVSSSGTKVFAAVNVHESADVSETDQIVVKGVLTQQSIVKAKVVTDAQVCLCVDAGNAISTSSLSLPGDVSAAIKADLLSSIKKNPKLNVNALGGALTADADIKVDNQLSITAATACKCGAGRTPTCVNGKCGCS